MFHRGILTTSAAPPRGRQRTRLAVLGIASLVAALAASALRPAAQKPAAATPVRLLPPGHVAGNAGEKGATYYSLELQSTRFVTRFADGTIATAQRAIDGDVTTRLEDRQGRELTRFKADRTDGINDVLQYVPAGGTPLLAQADPSVRITLDWANAQSHRLYQDRADHNTPLEWRGHMMRAVGGAPAREEADADALQVETQWTNGLSARTTRVHPKAGEKFGDRTIEGDVLATRVMRNGVDVGVANYLVRERIYAWSMPGVTEGLIANEHLKPRHGGWPFTPDMVWTNLQALALYQWKTTINETGFVAQNGTCGPATPRLAQRLLQLVVPVVHANEPGCDDLHWLDGTVFRFCCDIHDMCYEKYGCSSSSWWQWWSSWQCDFCNMGAAWCFLGGGVKKPFVMGP